MQELQKNKRYIDIQEKYKGDKEKLAQEQMKLYQELENQPLLILSANLASIPDHHWTLPGIDPEYCFGTTGYAKVVTTYLSEIPGYFRIISP